MRPQVGEVISGKYRLVRLIGEGGMGSVYEARHEYLGSTFALKFLDPDLARRPGLVARFLQEARVSASVRSSHVVLVSDVDQTSAGLPYLVMELLEGESLQRMLGRTGRLPVNTALDFGTQILNGLEAAHGANIVHRDLKPDNVYIVPTRSGPLVKLLDFGIAKLRASEEFQRGLTRPGVLMGTPEYMAPEQAFSADTADPRADLYSLGVIIFEMVTGRRPVTGDDPRIMAAGVLAGRIPSMIDVDPTLPPALSALVQRAMAGRPADRFANAAEMRDALSPFFTPTHNSGASSQPSQPSQIQAPGQPAPGIAPIAVAPAAGAVGAVAAQAGPAPTAPGNTPVPGGVAPTLPPEEPAQQPGAMRTGTVVGGGNLPAGDYGSTAAMSPYGYATAPNRPPPPAVPAYPMTAPPTTRMGTRKGVSIGLIAGILGAFAAVGAIAVFVYINREPNDPGPGPTQTQPPLTNTVTATTPTETATPTTPTGVVPTQPTTTSTRPPGTTTGTGPAPASKDGGTDGGDTDGGPRKFPFPVPSGLPSSIPIPMPSFPIPIPGFP